MVAALLIRNTKMSNLFLRNRKEVGWLSNGTSIIVLMVLIGIFSNQMFRGGCVERKIVASNTKKCEISSVEGKYTRRSFVA